MCDVNIGLIFLMYCIKDEVKYLIRSWKEEYVLIYIFIVEDGVKYVVWKIVDEDVIMILVNVFEDIFNFYIVDGYYCFVLVVKVGFMWRE